MIHYPHLNKKTATTRIESKMSHNITARLTNDERKIFASLPFFGGTTPEGGAVTDEKKKDPAKATTEDAGGTTTTEEDPIAKLQSDPNALRDLLNQVSKTSADLANATKERDTLSQEKEKAARAQMSKEEGLQKDLENAQIQIEAYHRVVETVALQNAFITASGDTQWNSVKQAMAELDEEKYSVNVNLENSNAEVEGIENEVKRIAKECPWLVKSAGEGEGETLRRGPGRPRTTGTPPGAPKAGGKTDKRDQMMNRFPVLMHGR